VKTGLHPIRAKVKVEQVAPRDRTLPSITDQQYAHTEPERSASVYLAAKELLVSQASTIAFHCG
jgi:hypothetical protein